MGIERPEQVGGMQPSSLFRCDDIHRRYSIALMVYASIREAGFGGPVDIVALTKSQRQIEAICLDSSTDWSPCLNRFFKVACWFEDRRIKLDAPDAEGVCWITET